MADVKPLKLVAAGGGLGELRELADGDGEWWVVAPYCTVGGTANALTLTLQHGLGKPSAYRDGQQFRFRASAANTGAATINVEGLGAKTAVTVTGVALPAGYIRTDVDTTITYDAVGDRFVVGREIERGSNANGEYERFAHGGQKCTFTKTASLGITTAALGGFRTSGAQFTGVFPAAFVSTPTLKGSPNNADFISAATSAGDTSSTTYGFLLWAVTSQASASRTLYGTAEGYWY